MSKSITLNLRVSGTLSEFVAAKVSDAGTYESIREHVDLIGRDKERVGAERLVALQVELAAAFGAPEPAYRPLDADTVISRNTPG